MVLFPDVKKLFILISSLELVLGLVICKLYLIFLLYFLLFFKLFSSDFGLFKLKFNLDVIFLGVLKLFLFLLMFCFCNKEKIFEVEFGGNFKLFKEVLLIDNLFTLIILILSLLFLLLFLFLLITFPFGL